jgi:hypothetical protein
MPQLPPGPRLSKCFFTTYVKLDAGDEGQDSGGMSFDCQLSVKFCKKEGSLIRALTKLLAMTLLASGS